MLLSGFRNTILFSKLKGDARPNMTVEFGEWAFHETKGLILKTVMEDMPLWSQLGFWDTISDHGSLWSHLVTVQPLPWPTLPVSSRFTGSFVTASFYPPEIHPQFAFSGSSDGLLTPGHTWLSGPQEVAICFTNLEHWGVSCLQGPFWFCIWLDL